MGKKQSDFEDYDDDIVVDRKQKRKLARQASREQQQTQQQVDHQIESDDTMSRIALLCQEDRWREAVVLCRTCLAEALENDEADLALTLEMTLPKLEYSLRRQMCASFVVSVEQMMEKEKETLLDAGKQ
ncbi:MAG: hypothetical protein GX561_01040 [Lentisphaerae bacterium]|jgi:hypothetical protein|nr:hypothetical protein [Lentisphaerota bacterium]